MMDRFSIVRQIDRQSDGQMRVKELQKNFFCSLLYPFAPSRSFLPLFSLYLQTLENLSISYVSPVSGSELTHRTGWSGVDGGGESVSFAFEEDGRGVIVYPSLH